MLPGTREAAHQLDDDGEEETDAFTPQLPSERQANGQAGKQANGHHHTFRHDHSHPGATTRSRRGSHGRLRAAGGKQAGRRAGMGAYISIIYFYTYIYIRMLPGTREAQVRARAHARCACAHACPVRVLTRPSR
jgi:hypothetical protein